MGFHDGRWTAIITAALLPLIQTVVAAVPRPVVAAFILDMGVGFVRPLRNPNLHSLTPWRLAGCELAHLCKELREAGSPSSR